MELNRNSWWIKFYLHFNTYYPTNFCDYFWGSIKSIFISLFSITITLLLIFTLLSPLLLFWYDYDDKSNLSGFQTFGFLTWIIIIIIFIIFKIINYYENKPYKYKPKKKSLIKQWYLDFKNKHCTLITWK
jgi:hypothetical protein